MAMIILTVVAIIFVYFVGRSDGRMAESHKSICTKRRCGDIYESLYKISLSYRGAISELTAARYENAKLARRIHGQRIAIGNLKAMLNDSEEFETTDNHFLLSDASV